MSDQQTPTVLWKWAKTHRASVNLRRFRSEEHTSELQSQSNIVCRLLLEKKEQNGNLLLAHVGLAEGQHQSAIEMLRRFPLDRHHAFDAQAYRRLGTSSLRVASLK